MLQKAMRLSETLATNKKRDRLLKKPRKQWVEMLVQLRFGSPAADIDPGQCQDMLDFLVCKYWIDGEPPKPRIETHEIKLVSTTAGVLREHLPKDAWARTNRLPHSEKGWPIFYEHNGALIYLDGRRRLNKWANQDPSMGIFYWVIREI